MKRSSNRLRDFILYMAGGSTPKTTEGEKYYSDAQNGIPFLRVQNLSPEGLQLDDCKFINQETHNGILMRSKVYENNLLTKITGVGRMAISSVAPKCFEGNINQHMVVIRTENEKTSKLLAAYLNSDVGEKLASRRATGGTRPALDYTALRSTPVILDEGIAQIMDAAYKEKLQKEQQAKGLLDSINSFLLGELGITALHEEESTLENRKFYVRSDKVLGRRFDPFYNKPIFEVNMRSITNCKNGTILLRDVIIGNLIKGILPNDIQKDGECKVVQISNINSDGSIDISSNITAKPIFLPKHKLQIGDILIVITGATIGKVGFWDCKGEYYLGGDIVKFNTGNYRLNEIYAALLRTEPYQLQIKRCITGATNGHLAPLDVEMLPLPIINDVSIQDSISNKLASIRAEVKALERQAKDAVKIAKVKVEKILLEGNL